MVYCLHVVDDEVDVVFLKKIDDVICSSLLPPLSSSLLLSLSLSLSLSPHPSYIPLRFDDERASIIVHLRY